MSEALHRESGYQSRIRASVVRLFCWTGAWLAATALMVFGPKFVWDKALALTLAAAGVNIAMGIGMIVANKKYLDDLDELQRKVQLNSFAITAGVALIVGGPYALMDAYGVIPFHAGISHLIMLMGVTYAVCNLYGTSKYR